MRKSKWEYRESFETVYREPIDEKITELYKNMWEKGSEAMEKTLKGLDDFPGLRDHLKDYADSVISERWDNWKEVIDYDIWEWLPMLEVLQVKHKEKKFWEVGSISFQYYDDVGTKEFFISKNEKDKKWELWIAFEVEDNITMRACLTVRGPSKNTTLEKAAETMLEIYFEARDEDALHGGESDTVCDYSNLLEGVEIDRIFEMVRSDDPD